MVYGYVRGSTDKQTVDNQRFEIERFCSKNSIAIPEDGYFIFEKHQKSSILA